MRLSKSNSGTKSFTFAEDKTVEITAFLATYGPASIKVMLKKATGEESVLMEWSRQDDMDSSMLFFQGKPVPSSMKEVKPGDFSAIPTSKTYHGKKGEVITLTLEGAFGVAEPLLTLE